MSLEWPCMDRASRDTAARYARRATRERHGTPRGSARTGRRRMASDDALRPRGGIHRVLCPRQPTPAYEEVAAERASRLSIAETETPRRSFTLALRVTIAAEAVKSRAAPSGD